MSIYINKHCLIYCRKALLNYLILFRFIIYSTFLTIHDLSLTWGWFKYERREALQEGSPLHERLLLHQGSLLHESYG